MTENTTTTPVVLHISDETAAALVNTIKSAVNGRGKYAAYVTAHAVASGNVKDHAFALAVLAYPNDKPVQKTDGTRTRFGNAVQAAAYGLRNVLDKDENSDTTKNLLTREGKSATLEAVIAEWENAQS